MRISDTRLQNFRHLLAENKLRLIDIAELLGKAPAQVSAFGGKNPTKGIGDQIAREIERALKLPHGSLDIPTTSAQPSNNQTVNWSNKKIPVIGSIAVGKWCSSADAFDPKDADEWINAPDKVGPRAFVFRIEGISMEPKFSEGDKVVIDPTLEAQPGNFVVVKRESDDAATFRQLKLEGSEFYLYALNPDWPERITRMSEEWRICGRARWRISDL